MTESETAPLIIRLSVIWLVLSGLILAYRQPLLSLTKNILIGFFVRFLAACLAGTALTVQYGHWVIEYVLFYLACAVNTLQSEYSVALNLYPERPDMIQSVATLLQGIPPMIAGAALPTFIYIFDWTMPVVLVFALLCAWPVQSLRSRIFKLLLSLPLITLFLFLAGPFTITGSYELMFQALAKFNTIDRPVPFFFLWFQFLEGGGRWLLVFALAFLGKWVINRNHRLKKKTVC